MLGRVVFGLRTWMCTMAAPALAASMEDWAICSGVTGTAGLRPGVSAEPVTAHEIMTLRCMVPPSPCALRLAGETLCEVVAQAESAMARGHIVPRAQERERPATAPTCHPLCTA